MGTTLPNSPLPSVEEGEEAQRGLSTDRRERKFCVRSLSIRNLMSLWGLQVRPLDVESKLHSDGGFRTWYGIILELHLTSDVEVENPTGAKMEEQVDRLVKKVWCNSPLPSFPPLCILLDLRLQIL
jgi:hypothetical protein